MSPPFDSREITVLVSALFVLANTVRFRSDLRRIPNWRLLNLAMCCLVIGAAATVLEHFGPYEAFNLIEHTAYLLQSLTLAAWAYRNQRVSG